MPQLMIFSIHAVGAAILDWADSIARLIQLMDVHNLDIAL
jgi:hypothetical protein